MKKYRKLSEQWVSAMILDLDFDTLRYRKWGGEQQAVKGDWLVSNGKETYTVNSDSFARTYSAGSDANTYKKVATVWAEEAKSDDVIVTKEGASSYKAGDFLVYNEEGRGDGYAIGQHEFNRNYKEVDPVAAEEAHSATDDQADYIGVRDYLKLRVSDQISWYEKKAAQNQSAFKKMQITSILFGSAIPILTVIDFSDIDVYVRLVIALLGSGVAIISAIVSLYKFEHYWVKYRTAAQLLIREKNFFLTKTKPYESSKSFPLFVKNCEAIMSAENAEWNQLVAAGKEQDGE